MTYESDIIELNNPLPEEVYSLIDMCIGMSAYITHNLTDRKCDVILQSYENVIFTLRFENDGSNWRPYQINTNAAVRDIAWQSM